MDCKIGNVMDDFDLVENSFPSWMAFSVNLIKGVLVGGAGYPFMICNDLVATRYTLSAKAPTPV